MGILIKDARSLEIARDLDVIVLDKTGTITRGRAELTDWQWLSEKIDKQEISRILLAAENRSEHPVARTIAGRLKEEGVAEAELESFESVTGKGVKVVASGETYLIGNYKMMEAAGLQIPEDITEITERWISEAKSVNYIAHASGILAIVAVADPIRENAPKVIEALNRLGVEVHMVTGDNPKTAARIAKAAGINISRQRSLRWASWNM